jgi:hypothetical protein
MINFSSSIANVKKLIKGSDINKEQEDFLLDELPDMDKKDRVELVGTLKKIYLLNEEEKQALKKLKTNWQ